MVCPGGLDSGLVHRDNSAVGVGDQAVVAVAVSGTVGSTVGNRVSSVQTSMTTTGGEVVGTSSSHGGLIHGDYGSVRVTNQVGVQVEWAGVAVASSVAKTSGGVGRATDAGVSNSVGNGSSSSIPYTSVPGTSIETSTATAGSKVVSTGSSHSGLIHGDDGTVGVGDQAVLGSRDRETGGENLKCWV